MNSRLAMLLVVVPFIIPQITWGANKEQKPSAAEQTAALPFDKTIPLPGAFAISSDGRIAAHISISGDIIIWDASRIKLLEIIPSGGKQPSSISLNSDGNMVAIGYADSRLIVRSRQEKRLVREFYGHSGGISALSFSFDGKLLASGGSDATTQLWDVATGKRLHVFDSMAYGDISSASGIPVSIGFSGDGEALIVNEWYSGFYDVGRGITIWDIKEGVEISTRDVAPPNSDNAMRPGHALGGKGWLLTYTGGWVSDKTGLMVERLDQCEPPRQLPSGGFADTVAADRLGRWVAATEDGKVTFFGMNSDDKSYAIELPARAIALVPHPDGRSVFALMIADTRTNGNEHFIFGRDAETVIGSALYRISVPEPLWHSRQLAVKDDAAHCAPTEATRRRHDYKLSDKPSELAAIAKLVPTKEMIIDPGNPTGEHNGINPPKELYFGQNESLYALYFAESNFRSGVALWDLRASRLLRGRFSPYVVSNIIRLREGWGEAKDTLTDLLTGQRLSSVSNEDDTSRYVSLTSDLDTGQFFRLTAKQVERYSAEGRRTSSIKVSKNIAAYAVRNGRLAALYKDGNVKLLQLEPPGESKTYKLELTPDLIESAGELALSADGHYLRIVFENASGDGPDRYAVYRLSSGQLVGDGELLAPFPRGANRGVVADRRPHHLAVWDFDKNEIIARLPRHRSRDKSGAYKPLRAAFSDDGRLLASASYDGLVRIWDIDAHLMIGEGRIGGEVTAIAFDSTGQRLAAGRMDGQIIVFQLPATK